MNAFLSTIRFVAGMMALALNPAQAASIDNVRTKAERANTKDAATLAEDRNTTSHVMTVRGKQLRYQATAGRLYVRDDSDKPQSRMFYVAYTKDGSIARDRPVTFLFNGGPGSSSIYLHMGSFGPVRVSPPAPGSKLLPRAGVMPNPSTLLDVTDLVFIDMIGTGYSRLEPGVDGKRVWSVDDDADTFSRFISSWVQAHNRELSPKFLLGESYGSLRAAVLANRLHSAGLSLNGIILAGAVLNFGVLFPSGYDQSYVSYLPSMAAVAWYHAKPANRSPDLQDFLAQVRAFASGPYQQALAKGHEISSEEARSVAMRYTKLTGLNIEYVLAANLRLDPENFRKELLRSAGLVIGRFDGRLTGPDSSSTGTTPQSDPSNTIVQPILTASLQDYMRNVLNYAPALNYRFGIQDLPEFDFDFRHQPPIGAPQLTPDAGVDLAVAMRQNPGLKVIFLNGYYDLATPFAAAEYDASHLLLPSERRRNISFRYYEAGHMLYFDDDVLTKLHDDLALFISDAISPAN